MLLDAVGSEIPHVPANDTAPPRLVCLCVAACVALDFGLNAADLLGRTCRNPRLVHARQIAMYLAHVGFGVPFDAVGRHFGRDRTTVAHACRVIEEARDDRWLDCRIAALDEVSRDAIAAGASR